MDLNCCNWIGPAFKIFFLSFLISCSSDDKKSSTPLPEPLIMISSGNTATANISLYSVNGDFVSTTYDSKNLASVPRGLAKVSQKNYVISLEGADALLQSTEDHNPSFLYGSSLFLGNINDIEYNSVNDLIYIVKTNNIEIFERNGNRLLFYMIPQTLGACTLNNPKNMYLTDDGYLYVASTSNSRILKYDVRTPVAVCLNSYAIGTLQPSDVILHSNGLLYISGTNLNAVYTFDETTLSLNSIFNPGLLVLSAPTALLELPNGDVLVSSSLTNSIERITPNGDRIGLTPFINDSASSNIADMIIY